jgi:hypothetical protein
VVISPQSRLVNWSRIFQLDVLCPTKPVACSICICGHFEGKSPAVFGLYWPSTFPQDRPPGNPKDCIPPGLVVLLLLPEDTDSRMVSRLCNTVPYGRGRSALLHTLRRPRRRRRGAARQECWHYLSAFQRSPELPRFRLTSLGDWPASSWPPAQRARGSRGARRVPKRRNIGLPKGGKAGLGTFPAGTELAAVGAVLASTIE